MHSHDNMLLPYCLSYANPVGKIIDNSLSNCFMVGM